ncbi:hypothetical protein IRJ41_025392, partial [Triplophysa rosa]
KKQTIRTSTSKPGNYAVRSVPSHLSHITSGQMERIFCFLMTLVHLWNGHQLSGKIQLKWSPANSNCQSLNRSLLFLVTSYIEAGSTHSLALHVRTL